MNSTLEVLTDMIKKNSIGRALKYDLPEDGIGWSWDEWRKVKTNCNLWLTCIREEYQEVEESVYEEEQENEG